MSEYGGAKGSRSAGPDFYRTAREWRVLVGQFLWDTCLSRWGVGPAGRQAFATIALHAGIMGRIDTEGRLRPVDGARAPL